jgi:hypothetical protein
MARTDSMSRAALISISKQIAEAIRLVPDKRFYADEAAPLKLGTTLTVWGITPEALAALTEGVDPRELRTWTQWTEFWHHQILFNTKSRAYAVSQASPENPDEVTLAELGIAAIAEQIEEAIQRVENDLQRNPKKYDLRSPYDPLVRLLEIPSRRVTALLLLDEPHDDTHLLIIEAQFDDKDLTPGAVLEQVDFLKGIARQPFVPGII